MAVSLPSFEDGAASGRVGDLTAIQELVARDLERVNALIMDHMQSPVALIPQLAGHIIAAGGKRLRPILTLASAQLCGYEGERHYPLAAAIEFMHTATLLHDDVVDASDLRRGLATANAVWGNKPSVLVGDFLFSRAFQMMILDGSLPVLKILADASATIAEGEVLQLITANDITATEEAYLQVIASKTAALFAAATKIGAVVAGRSEAEITAVEQYGHHLGMAFQLIDDMLDFSAREVELGKAIGDDFRDGKMTLPIVLAIAAADDEERGFWQRTMEAQDQAEGDLDHAIALLRRHRTLEQTFARAREFADRAEAALRIFPDSPARRAMLDVVAFCLQRGY